MNEDEQKTIADEREHNDYLMDKLLSVQIRCYSCGREMIQTNMTPVGLKNNDLVDNFYFVHPPDDDCRVGDYVIKVGYKA